MSKYYTVTGDSRLSMAYMDSTLAVIKKLDEQFSALQIVRFEQRKHLAAQRLREEQLLTERIRSEGYRRNLIIVAIALLLIGFGMVRYYVLYRKKKTAYHELALKLQAWAQSSDVKMLESFVEAEKQNDVAEDYDLALMKEIEQVILEHKLYRDAELSIDLLARKLGAKRLYVSNAINHCMKKSFNTFINEYRIKEAIRLLSTNALHTYTIESIGMDVGFNNRQHFHRVFKKTTGLSPLDFKKNITN
jgi:YesN/AraC family two-component response regulator